MTTENRTLKIPAVLYRAGTFKVVKQDDPDNIRLSVSSDVPYLRYDYECQQEYYEKLDHSATGVNLTRINTGTALLYNHDTGIHLGKITKPELVNGKLFVAAKLTKAADVASHRTRIDEGILTDSSIAYEVLDQGVEDGEIDGVPVYRFKWAPYEASLCPVAADITTGIGRNYRSIRIIEKKEKDIVDNDTKQSQKRETETFMETPVAEPKVKTQAELAAEENERKQFLKDEREADRARQKEIRAIAKRGTNVPDEVVEKAIDDETTADNFRKLVFEKYFGNAEPIDTPSGQGGGDLGSGSGKKGSLSLGAQFVQAPAVKALNGKLQRGASIGVEMPNVSMIGIRGKVAMAQRAGFTSSDLTAVNVTIAPGIIALGVQRLTIMDVIASGTIGTGAYKYARENGFGTIDGVAVAAGAMPRAKSVGERGLKPSWEPDLTTETANVCKVAITTKVPDEFLSDFPSAMSYIDERLPLMVDTETEFQILYGDGLNNNLKGIFTTAGVQTRAITTTDDSTKAASIRQGITDIQVGAKFEPDFIGFHPYDWETASLLKDSTGRFLAGGPFYIPYTAGVFLEVYTFWGKRVVVSTAITYGKPIVGCGKLGAQALIREGMRIEMTNSNEDDFRRNLVCLRAEHRLALPVYRPVAFLEFTGWPARA